MLLFQGAAAPEEITQEEEGQNILSTFGYE